MATKARVFVVLLPPRGGAAAAREAPVKLCDVASESANATSRADWKRFSRSFSRQCRTTLSRAGDTFRPDSESSGGSSRMTAAIVSLAVSRLNALRPVRSSYRIAPKEKMSERWSTGNPRTCSGDM